VARNSGGVNPNKNTKYIWWGVEICAFNDHHARGTKCRYVHTTRTSVPYESRLCLYRLFRRSIKPSNSTEPLAIFRPCSKFFWSGFTHLAPVRTEHCRCCFISFFIYIFCFL